MADASRGEMYVGYLPVPKGIRRFLLVAAPLLAAVIIAAGLMISLTQRDPGGAVWNTQTPVTLTGRLVVDPYPMLLVNDGGTFGTLLLVEEGKHGASARCEPHAGKIVSVTGAILQREDQRMLEIAAADGALRELDAKDHAGSTPEPTASARSLGRLTLRGEIVDAKCFMGAMKPGAGKPHKGCATLCIRGGIPPVLQTRDATGRAVYYLLVTDAGGPLPEAWYPLIADPVEVCGDAEDRGGLLQLKVAADGIRPI